MDVALEALYVLGVLMCCALLSREEGSREGLGSRRARLFMLALAVEAMQAGLGSLAFREPWGAPFAPWQAFDLAGAVLADLFLAWALLRGFARRRFPGGRGGCGVPTHERGPRVFSRPP